MFTNKKKGNVNKLDKMKIIFAGLDESSFTDVLDQTTRLYIPHTAVTQLQILTALYGHSIEQIFKCSAFKQFKCATINCKLYIIDLSFVDQYFNTIFNFGFAIDIRFQDQTQIEMTMKIKWHQDR